MSYFKSMRVLRHKSDSEMHVELGMGTKYAVKGSRTIFF
jgi:hypothetical protein